MAQPVFLIGNQRSGTNMTVEALARSDDVQFFNENHPEAFRKVRLISIENTISLIESCRRSVILFKPITQTAKAIEFSEEIPGLKLLFIFRNYVDVVRSSMRRWGDDSGLEASLAGILNRKGAFALYREPAHEAKAARIRSLHGKGLDPPSKRALVWYCKHQLWLDLGLFELPNLMMLQYELSCERPEEEFRSICGFIGLPYKSAFIEGIELSRRWREEMPIDGAVAEACRRLTARLEAQLQVTRERVLGAPRANPMGKPG